jgi:hypothetical protein
MGQQKALTEGWLQLDTFFTILERKGQKELRLLPQKFRGQ